MSLQSASIPGYTSGTIHADHSQMTKFKTSSDSGYVAVEGELLAMIDQAALDRPASVAEEVKASWTKGTKSGPVNQGKVAISGSSISAGRDANIGNVARTSS